jgi:hypothetical protein
MFPTYQEDIGREKFKHAETYIILMVKWRICCIIQSSIHNLSTGITT